MKDQEFPGATKAGESRSDRRFHSPSLLHRLRSLFGLGAASLRDDIEDALDDNEAEDVFSPQERAMLRNVLGLHEVRVEDIMVPRADVVAVNLTMTLGEVLAMFRAAGHSRLPVHGDTLDDPRGMIHIRDFVDIIAGLDEATGAADPARVDLSLPVARADIMRPVIFVPPSMPAIDLLVKMQATRTHMALVIDEYGGTDGLVTIEDIVEMIVGDIEDEHDEDEQPLIAEADDGSFVADGRASLEDVSAAVGSDFLAAADADEIDTIGGLVTSIAGRVPDRGEIVFSEDGFAFEILDADPRRVKRIRFRLRDRLPDETQGPEAAAAVAVRPPAALPTAAVGAPSERP